LKKYVFADMLEVTMVERYDHVSVERKWQKRWQDDHVFRVENTGTKKHYILDMFPYPSADGLHVGHPEGYTATDIYSRFLRMSGYSVLHPMGWDAFGLPAENYAIKQGVHPSAITQKNIANFKRQIQSIGFSYDWSREVDTTDPTYYKWTQWIFLQLYKAGLAYEQEAPIWWCPKDKTGLANEEVVNGKCDRCGTAVEKKMLKQWMLKITAYADRLLSGLDDVEWPESIKSLQRNWIGKSEGAEVDFEIETLNQVQSDKSVVTVFTTRPDTLFGATYLVLAPEHTLVEKITTPEQREAVHQYIQSVAAKSDLERTSLEKEKTGVFTGAFAVNPVNNEKIPVWIADYVLSTYGTGAIMAVPAHDSRDYDFAKAHNLEIKPISFHFWLQKINDNELGITNLNRSFKFNSEQLEKLSRDVKKILDDNGPSSVPGILFNSGEFSGQWSEDVFDEIVKKAKGVKKTQYKLRDWVFSRQRYWGEPIPLIHCDDCGIVPVPEDQLPLELPQVEKYEPTGTGESPLASMTEWVNTTCPTCGKAAKRETNTMPQWAGSCWYYLRFCDPKNEKEFVSAAAMKAWLPVDMYVGGAEHAVLHLLYALFWHKVLFDAGHIPAEVGDEPFRRLKNQGLILGPDGEKMSKSRGNVINPDEIIAEFGADTLRMYEMFMGPFEDAKPWNTNGLIGVRRFIEKVVRAADRLESKEAHIRWHKYVQSITLGIQEFRLNTCVSDLMKWMNEFGNDPISQDEFSVFLRVLAPFAPHVAEELWSKMGNTTLLAKEVWPVFDPAKVVSESATIAVQVMGKLRATLTMPTGSTQKTVEDAAKAESNVQKFLTNEPKKVIYVQDKLINFVV
jgi:leucyl-tRNA synthetase